MTVPIFYARPRLTGGELAVQPALASWDRAGAPGHARLTAFVVEVCSVIAAALPVLTDPLALRLDVGLPHSVSLLAHNDLDNYLFPLIPKLTAATGRQFSTVWATKRHAATSSVAACEAHAADAPDAAFSARVRTTASAGTADYKRQIRDQVATGPVLPAGGVAVQLAFVVGPRRAWPNLWKATIDALGPVLGREPGAHEWSPRDGRIIDLALHRCVDPAAGDEVTIDIRAGVIDQETTT